MSETLRRSFILLAFTAGAMAALLAFFPAAGHDQLWFLLMARRWLGGATLYGPEIFDSNPPLVIWLSAIPVALGNLFHLPATLLAKTLVLLSSAAVAFLCFRILELVWRPVERSERPALLFGFIVLIFMVPARDLGQRDALAALFVLPYVLAAARTSEPASLRGILRWLAVTLAALGFCLKPQVALVAVAVEAAVLAEAWRRNRRPTTYLRPEIAILAICGLLYLLAIHRLAPLYFTETLPVLRNTYWAIGHLSVTRLLWEGVELTILAVLTSVLLLRLKPVSPATRLSLIAGFGAFLAYLLQGTGWYYQQLPAITLFGIALVLQLLDLQKRHPLRPPRYVVRALACLCLLAVALTTHFSGYPFTKDRAFALNSPNPGFFAGLAPGTPVAILTTSVDEAMMPIERYGLTWAQRTNNLWLLPAILRSEASTPDHPASRHLSPLTLARLEAMQHRWMVEDFTRWHPQLVLVERCGDPAVACQVLEDRHDNLLAWFHRDPAFQALWRSYHFAETRGRFDAYRLQPAR